MAFTQMKMVAANIIHKYEVEVVDGHPIVPHDSIILQMKHGLKVRDSGWPREVLSQKDHPVVPGDSVYVIVTCKLVVY